MIPTHIKWLVCGILSVLTLVILTPVAVVGSGQRGVVTHFGKVQEEVLDEGIHLVVPVLTSVHKISVRVQKTETESEAASKDMQKVTTKIALNWHINPTTVNKLYQTVGGEDEIVQQIINPAVSEVLKAATAKLTAEEILTRRIELKQNIDDSLKNRLSTYNVMVDDVSLVDLHFTKEFDHAVESKQIAEQKAKEAEYDAVRASKEAMSEVNRAKGQAEAQKLLRQNLTPEILQQRAIEKWNGAFPQVMGNGSMPFLNLKMGTN